jgi:hypothetical protein
MVLKIDRFLRLLGRILIIGLIATEFLNRFGFLHFPLTFTWDGLIVTSIIVWLLLETTSLLLKKSCGLMLSGWIFPLAATVLYIDALGDILRLYSQFGWYDQVAHILGGMSVGATLFSVIHSYVHCGKIRLGRWGQGIFALFGAAFFGVLYELEEYFEDYFNHVHLRLGDGPDTANDLLLDVVGAGIIILLIILVIYNHKHRQEQPAQNNVHN